MNDESSFVVPKRPASTRLRTRPETSKSGVFNSLSHTEDSDRQELNGGRDRRSVSRTLEVSASKDDASSSISRRKNGRSTSATSFDRSDSNSSDVAPSFGRRRASAEAALRQFAIFKQKEDEDSDESDTEEAYEEDTDDSDIIEKSKKAKGKLALSKQAHTASTASSRKKAISAMETSQLRGDTGKKTKMQSLMKKQKTKQTTLNAKSFDSLDSQSNARPKQVHSRLQSPLDLSGLSGDQEEDLSELGLRRSVRQRSSSRVRVSYIDPDPDDIDEDEDEDENHSNKLDASSHRKRYRVVRSSGVTKKSAIHPSSTYSTSNVSDFAKMSDNDDDDEEEEGDSDQYGSHQKQNLSFASESDTFASDSVLEERG